MKLKRTQNGTSTVEFAMILPLLLVIIFGIMEFSLLLYDKAIITNASREAARSGIAYKSPRFTTAEIQAFAINPTKDPVTNQSLLISSISNEQPTAVVTFSNTFQADGKTPLTVTVTVTYPYTFFVFGGLYNLFTNGSMSNQIPISATTVMYNE
jgi:Flp pilus assembly protein TadG